VLTGELLRARRVGNAIVPRYLGPAQRRRLLAVADALIAAVGASAGARRDELEARLLEIDHAPADRRTVAGLRKLLLDRCELALPAGPDPIALRERLFCAAAAERQALGAADRFAPERLCERIAAELGLSPAALDEQLFADLAENERLLSFRPIDATALLGRYNVALAQAVLLNATRVVIELEAEEPGRVRALFRAARFHGLLHQVYALAEGRYRIELDGPLSLFSAVQKYGLRLALFLPALLGCQRWSLCAELRWGRSREPMLFQLGPKDHLLGAPGTAVGGAAESEPGAGPRLTPSLAELVERFRALGSSWEVAPSDRIFALPGELVCVPDLVFTSRESGELVYLEAFGFWSRAAVWQRIETLSRGFPARIILAVSKQLRVSEQAIEQGESGQVYVYGAKMSPRAILERLEAAHAVGGSSSSSAPQALRAGARAGPRAPARGSETKA